MKQEKINIITRIDIDTLNLLKELNISVDDYFTEESQNKINTYRKNKAYNNEYHQVKKSSSKFNLKPLLVIITLVLFAILVTPHLPHPDLNQTCNTCLGGHS